MSGMYKIHQTTSEVSYEMLRAIGQGGKFTFHILYNRLCKQFPHLQERQLRKRLDYYKKKQLLTGSAREGYLLSTAGTVTLAALNLTRPIQTDQWDKKWRIIAFDVPEDKREARDALRRLIKQLGCHQLQRSLWIHPLPCLEHFKVLEKAYDLGEHIVLIETSWIDNHHALFAEFKKKYPKL